MSEADSSRKQWDRKEYEEKAKQKDEEARKHAEETEKALREGKKPPKRKQDLPKPTELLKAREQPLELGKNEGKTLLASEAQGSRGPGFYCSTCNRTYKDSVGYLDHINGRGHLRRLGQTTRVARSTVDQVRAKIAALREQTANSADAKRYDFHERLKQIRQHEQNERIQRRQQKKEQKEKQRQQQNDGGDAQVMEAMGFGSFGAAQKR